MAGSSQDLGPSDPANIHQSVSTASERNRVSIDSIHSYSQDDADDLILDDHEPILANTSPARPFRGNTRIKGPNTICRIVFLTLCLAGLQFTWTVEMAYGTPYLLSLGLTKSSMSLVWIAGPLSGLLMQPIVGVLSDRCTSRFGRRRPFLIIGSIIVTFSLLVIGWTREITGMLTGSQEGESFTKLSIFIAISSIYILDFSINCVQASCRALLVDSLPPSLQEDGTAWAGRMVGLGNVVGYFMGYADLVAAFPFLGDTQLKVLCVIAAIVLLLCDAVTCYAVSEKTLVKQPEKNSWKAPFKALTAITSSIWNLPKPIQRICNVQFFAWIGWFPFLFYSTTWVAEIYDQNALQQPNDDSDAVGQATRAGSFAFLVYSIVSLGASFLLPLIVAPSYNQDPSKATGPTFKFTYKGVTYSITPSKYLKFSFLTLPRAWTASHVIFFISMLCTIFVWNVLGASIVIGICGISWSLTMWAPFSLLGEYISESEAKQQTQDREYDEENPLGVHRVAMSSRVSLAAGGAGLGAEGGIYQLVEQQIEDSREIDGQMEMQPYKDESTQPEERQSNEITNDQQRTDVNLGPSAGVLLGIHNMYIVLPQFLVTFFSSIIFHFLEKGTPEDGEASSDAIGVVLRFGAIMAGIAAYLSTRIGKNP